MPLQLRRMPPRTWCLGGWRRWRSTPFRGESCEILLARLQGCHFFAGGVLKVHAKPNGPYDQLRPLRSKVSAPSAIRTISRRMGRSGSKPLR
jgi:hypothetical protein